MESTTKTPMFGFLLAAAALAGACAHQADADLLPADLGDDGGSRGGSTASGGGGSGSVGINPNQTPSGKGGSTSSAGKGGSTSSGSGGSEDGGSTGSEDGGSGGSPDDVGGGEPAPDTGFSVLYMASQTGDSSVAISSQFVIRNDSTETVPLSEFKLRYFFTDELTSPPNLQMFWAHLTGGAGFSFTLAQVDLPESAPGADSYFEFTMGSDAPMLAPGQQAELAWQSHNGSSEINIQTNDYSFDATKTQYTAWDHVQLLRNGEPYWGTPP